MNISIETNSARRPWPSSGPVRAGTTMVEALSPVCQRSSGMDAHLMALNKVASWAQIGFVEKGGRVTFVDSTTTAQMLSVARTRANEGPNVKDSMHAR